MADWSKPTLSSTYADHHDELRARDEDSARLFSVGTPTNVPTGAIRWNSSTNALQKWDGSAWGSLTTTYAFTAANFSGAVDIQNDLTVLGTLEVATALEAGSFTPDSSSIPVQGMYRPGTNQLGFSTDSVLRQSISSTGIHRWHGVFAGFDMYWQSGTGSLGIGCNPAVGYVLDVDGNAQIGATTGTSALFIGGRIATSTNRSAHIDLVGDNTYAYGLRIERGSTGANTTSKIVHRGTGNLEIVANEAANIAFKAAGGTRLTVASNGNIGCHTTNPTYPFESHGNALIQGVLYTNVLDAAISITTNGTVTWSGGSSTNANTAYGWGNHATAGYLPGTNPVAQGYLYIDSPNDGNLAAILKLGDGRTSSGYTGIDLVGDSTYTTYGLRISRSDTGANASAYVTNRGTGSLIIRTLDNGPLRLRTADSDRIYITATGNVGMGTTSPSYKLDVNGTARFGSNTNVDGDLQILGMVKSVIGFYAYGTTKGINGSGNFVNGTIAGASDVSASNTANTVALRNSSADIYARLFRSTYQNQSTIGGAMAFRTSTTDNYIRFCSSPSAVRTWLGALGSNVANQKVQSYFTITRNSNHGVLEFEDSNGAQRMHVYHYNAGDNGGIGVFDSNGQNRSDLLLYRNGGMTWRGSSVFTGGSTIMPDTDSTYDVGDIMYRFRNLWIKTIYATDLMEMRPTSATATVKQKIGENRSGNGYSYIDFIGDATHTDYGLRVLRGNGGANTWSGIYHRGTGGMYMVASDSASIYFRTQNTDRMQINSSGEVSIGQLGTNTESRLKIYRKDDDFSDHIQFYRNTTRMGEIGCQDSSWLRINQSTNKNIFTPRLIRADGGFFVDGSSKGINGSGNFVGGTIAGASDYGTLLRSNASDIYGGGQLNINSDSVDGHYWGAGLEWSSGWRHTNANSWGFAFRNSGGSLEIYSAKEAGTNHGAATYRSFEIGGSSQLLKYDGNDVWHAGNVIQYNTNDAILQFRNTSYGKYLYIGGWSSANSSGISRIRNSNANLHLDSGSDGNCYLNWYASNRTIYLGNTGQTVRAAGSNLVWHEGNDGSGSGLDADTVDGIQGASLIRSDANDNVSAHTEWQDNFGVRMGNDADFRMWWSSNGNMYFRQYSHAGGNIYFQGENSAGTNKALFYMYTEGLRPFSILYEDGGERLRTQTNGVRVYGSNPAILRLQDGGHTNTYTDFQHDNGAFNIIARGGTSYSSINFYQYNGTTNRLSAKFQASGGHFYPGVSGVNQMGNGSNRWKRLYATTATSVSSDRDLKQDIEELNEKEKKVAVTLKGLIRKYRLISEVQEIGDKAKVHIGVIAQDVAAAFEEEGLDPNEYELYENEMIHEDENGNECSQEDAVTSTRCLGIIYSELLAFIISAM